VFSALTRPSVAPIPAQQQPHGEEQSGEDGGAFYSRAVLSTARKLDVRFSVTARQNRKIRAAIEAIPEAAWQPIPYWLSTPEVSGADVAETRIAASPAAATRSMCALLFAAFARPLGRNWRCSPRGTTTPLSPTGPANSSRSRPTTAGTPSLGSPSPS